MTTKVCTKCGIEKSIRQFKKSYNQRGDLYRRRQCKTCRALYRHEYRQKYLGNRNSDLKREYGIDLNEYERLFRNQNGACAICGKSEVEQGRHGKILNLAVDHDHHNQKIRGLLCAKCNRAIGLFQHNSEYLLNASNYLEGIYETKRT